MEQNKQQRIRELTDRLNRCRYEYYNLNAPSLTDAEYDALFDELSTLEKQTGFSMTNSPTQTVSLFEMLYLEAGMSDRNIFVYVEMKNLKHRMNYLRVSI